MDTDVGTRLHQLLHTFLMATRTHTYQMITQRSWSTHVPARHPHLPDNRTFHLSPHSPTPGREMQWSNSYLVLHIHHSTFLQQQTQTICSSSTKNIQCACVYVYVCVCTCVCVRVCVCCMCIYLRVMCSIL